MKKVFFSSLLITIFSFVITKPLFAATLTNPLGTSNPNEIIANVIQVFLGIVGAIALVIIIYGGFQLLISAGNQERVDKGRKALLWAVIGLVVVFGSYGLTVAIFNALAGEPI